MKGRPLRPIPRPDLTEREKEFLRATRHLFKRRLPPTIVELAKKTGLSKGGAAYHIRELCHKGYLRRTPGKSRSLEIVE